MEFLHIVENITITTVIEPIKIKQLTHSSFNDACLQKNSQSTDNTGLRIHAGAYVACQFLLRYSELLDGKNIIELGCGTGILGIFAAKYCNIRSVVFTDANSHSLQICHDNYLDNISAQSEVTASYYNLVWGHESTARLMSQFAGVKFEVVIGCELMYYNTDVSEIISTINVIFSSSDAPVFLHAHIFRGIKQETELQLCLCRIGWKSLEVPVELFINEQDLTNHPEWFKVRCLLSAPEAIATQLHLKYNNWINFNPDNENSDNDS